MESTGDLSMTLQTVAGCAYSLGSFLALALAVFAAVKLKRSMGAWALTVGLAMGTLAAVVGDALVIGEIDRSVSQYLWLAVSLLGLLAALIMLAGVAMLSPPKEGGA